MTPLFILIDFWLGFSILKNERPYLILWKCAEIYRTKWKIINNLSIIVKIIWTIRMPFEYLYEKCTCSSTDTFVYVALPKGNQHYCSTEECKEEWWCQVDPCSALHKVFVSTNNSNWMLNSIKGILQNTVSTTIAVFESFNTDFHGGLLLVVLYTHDSLQASCLPLHQHFLRIPLKE